MLMSALDFTIVTIALPDITRSVHASVVESMWIVLAYSLVVAGLLLPMSRLSDMKGRVRLYNLGFAIFTIASALCGISQTGSQLVLFRVIQAAGAALLMANSTALATDAFPGSQRGFALGINQMAGITGFILGTVFGGIITQFLGWRYIFFINIPFGIFATVWAFLKLHEIVEPERQARLDVGGMITFPLGITGILGALTLVTMGKAGSPFTIIFSLAGTFLLAIFVLIESRVAQPMIDLSLFRIRLFWAGNASLFLNSLGRGSTMFIMSWYFQAVLNNSPTIAGLKLLPLAVATMLLAPVAGRFSDRFGPRWLSTIGLFFTLVAQVWIIFFPVTVSYVTLAAALTILGIGNALFNTPNTSSVMGCVNSNRRGIAAGMRSLLQNTGQTMAISTTMVILSLDMSYQQLTALFAGTTSVGQISGLEFMHGFHTVFLFSSVITAVAIVCSSLRGT